MALKIKNGFPLRRCSWAYVPIVPIALSRKMIRWLDFVCVRQASSKATNQAAGRTWEEVPGVTHGT